MSSKKKKKQKDKAAATPLDSLQRALQDAAAEDVDDDGLDDGLDQVSDASHSDSPSSAHSAQGSSDHSNNFITSLGLTMCPGLEALAATVNASKPALFYDSVLVARKVLDSGRDLATVPPETFV